MNVLIANYGNESIAMIQWAIETQLPSFIVLSIDTGWHSESWQQHLTQVFNFLKANNIAYKHLPAKQSFEECVKDRGDFPSAKFQWCSSFLKGLALNEALDELDINGEATIHLAKMRVLSRSNATLISGQSSEHYQDRILSYPILDLSIEERDKLIRQAHFNVLTHRSDECLPCIHAKPSDFLRMSKHDRARLDKLEKGLAKPMFPNELSESSGLQGYDMGCGNIWGCGE